MKNLTPEEKSREDGWWPIVRALIIFLIVIGALLGIGIWVNSGSPVNNCDPGVTCQQPGPCDPGVTC